MRPLARGYRRGRTTAADGPSPRGQATPKVAKKAESGGFAEARIDAWGETSPDNDRRGCLRRRGHGG